MAKRPITRRKAILFILVINIFLLLVFEAGARVTFFAFSGDALSLVYGFNQDIKFDADQPLPENVRFYRDCIDCLGDPENQGIKTQPQVVLDPVSSRPLVWTFGGSTTHGYACSSQASSWPDELQAMAQNIRVENLGRNGRNSDYAVRQLIQALETGEPDVVLWANWINELDIIFEGMDRNYDKLVKIYPDLPQQNSQGIRYNSIIHFLARLDKTLYSRSSLYLMLKEVGIRLTRRTGITLGVTTSYRRDEQSINMSISNYELNLKDAHKLSDRFGFKLAIVTLPINWSIYAENHSEDTTAFVRQWDGRLHDFVTEFTNTYDIPSVDVHAWYQANGFIAEQFCDGVHQNKAGHQRTAQAIISLLPPTIMQ